jgi:hypothetical protein
MAVTSGATMIAYLHPSRAPLLLFFLILLSNWGVPFPVPSSRPPLLFATAATLYNGSAYESTYSKSCTDGGLLGITSTGVCQAVWGDAYCSSSKSFKWQGGTLTSKHPCGCYSMDSGTDVGYYARGGSSCGTHQDGGDHRQANYIDCFCEIPAPTMKVRNELERPNVH